MAFGAQPQSPPQQQAPQQQQQFQQQPAAGPPRPPGPPMQPQEGPPRPPQQGAPMGPPPGARPPGPPMQQQQPQGVPHPQQALPQGPPTQPWASTQAGFDVAKLMTACDLIIKHFGDGKTHLAVQQPQGPPPQQRAPQQGIPNPPAAGPPQAPAHFNQPSALPPGPLGDLTGKTRKELVDIAAGMGVDVKGLKVEDMRQRLMQAAGGGGQPQQQMQQPGFQQQAAPPQQQVAYDPALTAAKAQALMPLIEQNLPVFEQYISSQLQPGQRPQGWLGCEGDCQRCPNPERHPGGAPQQIAECYRTVHQTLNLQPQLPA